MSAEDADGFTSLPHEAGAPLDAVLRTGQLQARPSRAADHERENQTLTALTGSLADSPGTILQALAEAVIGLLGAGSAGLSLLTPDGLRFRWAAAAGAWAPLRGRDTLKDFSPCGDALAQAQLFTRWERRYPYLADIAPACEEALVVPFRVQGEAAGTIWAIAHDAQKAFDAEDLRLLQSLARIASAAVEFQKAEDARRRGLAWVRGQKEAFQASVKGAPLEASLEILAHSVVEYAGGGTQAAFFVLDDAGTSVHHVQGTETADDFAAATGADAGLDATVRAYLERARDRGYATAVSLLLQIEDERARGAFCLVSRPPRELTPQDMEVAGAACNAAALIMARHEAARKRARAEQALRTSEALQVFLLKLSDALRSLAKPEEIQSEAVRVLGRHLGVTRAQYYEVEANDEWVVSTGGYADGAPPIVERVRMDDFGAYVKTAFRAGETLVVADVLSDPRVSEDERAAYDALGIRAYVGVPLVKGGRFVATLAVNQTTPRDWTAEEIALIEEMAERTWAAVERARVEAALRASEEKYRTLFETMGQGYAEVEMIRDARGRVTDYRYVELNPAYERLTGIPTGDVRGRTTRELFPELADWGTAKFESVLQKGEPERFERDVARLGKWYEVYAYPKAGDRVISLFEDITLRKRAELELRASQQRQTFLLRFSDALRAQPDEDGVANLAISSLAQELDLDRCYLASIYEDEGRAEVTHQFARTGSQPVPRHLRLSDFPASVRQIQQGTLVVPDTMSTPDLSEMDRQSFAAMNFWRGGRGLRAPGRTKPRMGPDCRFRPPSTLDSRGDCPHRRAFRTHLGCGRARPC